MKKWIRKRSPSDAAFERLERAEAEAEAIPEAEIMASESGKQPAQQLDLSKEFKNFKAEVSSLIKSALKDITSTFDDRFQSLSSQNDDLKKDLLQEIQSLQTRVSNNDAELKKLAGEINQVQTLASKHESAFSAHEEEIDALQRKLIYMEDYSRRSNLKLINFELQDKKEIKKEILAWLNTILPQQLTEIDIERVHYIGSATAGVSRPILIRFTSYAMKEQLTSTLRAKPDLLKRDGRVLQVYQDISRETFEWRKSMRPVTTALRNNNYRYNWGFPIFLKVWKGPTLHKIYSLEEGEQLLKAWNIQIEKEE